MRDTQGTKKDVNGDAANGKAGTSRRTSREEAFGIRMLPAARYPETTQGIGPYNSESGAAGGCDPGTTWLRLRCQQVCSGSPAAKTFRGYKNQAALITVSRCARLRATRSFGVDLCIDVR
jgi:hypothetical protein